MKTNSVVKRPYATMSHEVAAKLLEAATVLLKRENFPLEHAPGPIKLEFNDRDAFMKAVQAVHSGRKEYHNYTFEFVPDGTDFVVLSTERSTVCKKIQEEKWECEPLLASQEFPEPEAPTNGAQIA